ncbi:CKLF-like MARVEL transmembrane domain-containing protein 6 [Ornithorhynchus anatinus]|uniref:CKLF-like MARVEL transmembrane domain-containing protein 6 n=1 Tax=Ornithorhynchus anatinus TaxID=9258 RepID=UPI0010A913CE|nr:CKLF-like MARVEL transmembrane domain-containing protein 6 [Ornithorhynchus anatinus]
MENGGDPAVYRPTTEAAPGGQAGGSRCGCGSPAFTLTRPTKKRGPLKLVQLVLSLLAFICEEVVSQCTACGGLYFFEFVSCSAFLLSLLVLIVYCTSVYDKVDAKKVKKSDFFITLVTGGVFLLASIIFAATNDQTSAEIAATVFGFLASFLFIIDFCVMVFEKLQNSKRRKTENMNAAAVSEPLTQQS